MDPLPETAATLHLLHDNDLAQNMRQAGADLAAAAPTAVGFSLGVVADGITLTYVSSDPSVALLDAVQYLAGGPCEDAIRDGRSRHFGWDDPLDEQSWELFAQAGASHGVRSTLSLPILHEGAVVADVNLYGSRPDTFHGRHEVVARIFGAWAPGAVSNADLSFRTRLEAVQTPGRIQGLNLVEMAVGVFVARYTLSPDAARDQLFRSAARAGISVVALARLVIDELQQRGS